MTDRDAVRGPVPGTAAEQRLVLGRYRLEERLGSGGSAEVWQARDERLGRSVAVKLLHPHLLPDSASRQRLEAEALAAARLAHPGIVAVYDVDAWGEAPVIVLELVEGESLAARLERDGKLAEREAVHVAAQLAEALQHAHDRGLVHRDVKPGNVLLTPDGNARLADFGIARSVQEGAARLTAAGTIIGTLRYMAPEQLRGADATPQSDVYAVGAVLYEALTGRPPFDAPTPVALAERQLRPPAPLDGVSPALAEIVLRALSADPGRRPGSGASLADELRRAVPAAGGSHDGSHATTAAAAAVAGVGAGVGTEAGVTAVRAAVGAPHPSAGDRDNRGRRRLIALGVAVAGALFGLAVAVAVIGPALQASLAGGALPAASPVEASDPSPTPTPTPFVEVAPVDDPAAEEPGNDTNGNNGDRGQGRGNGNGNAQDRGNDGDDDDDD